MPDNRTLKCVKISQRAAVIAAKLAGDESVNEWCRAVLLTAAGQHPEEPLLLGLQVAKQRNMLPRKSGVSIRMTAQEWKRLSRSAAAANLTLMEWVRLHLDHAAGVSAVADQIGHVRRQSARRAAV